MQVTRPEQITIGNATVTVRSPVAVWLLTFMTLGIYGIVWWYQVNRELRDYSQAVTRPFGNSPAVAATLVALWPLGLIPGMLSVFVSSRRVRTVQEWVEDTDRVSALLAALLFPLLFAHAWYVQRALNGAWELAKQGHGPPPDYAVASGQDARVATQAEIDRLGRATRWR